MQQADSAPHAVTSVAHLFTISAAGRRASIFAGVADGLDRKGAAYAQQWADAHTTWLATEIGSTHAIVATAARNSVYARAFRDEIRLYVGEIAAAVERAR